MKYVESALDTRLLRVFCSVATHGSLALAARELHLTPSALSHSLKALETHLGCRLFDRSGNKMLLNQAGEQLLARVQGPLAALAEAEESIKNLAHWGQTRLRIGAAASACQHILPAVLRELKKQHPNTIIQVESGDMPEMLEFIQANRVDLALGLQPERDPRFEARTIFRDELLLAFANSHSWALARSIAREDLRTQPLILYQRSSYTARMVDDFFRGMDLVPSSVMEVASIEAIKELVKLNLGVSVLAPWTADRELTRGSLKMRPPGPRPLRRQWVIAFAAGRRLGLVEETFCKLCRTYTAGMRLDRKDVPALNK
jgi:LysR family transcriptional regulator, low CO2-responsive transcriptional regulator